MKFFVGVDDALDLFAEHAIGGVIGLLCNAFFASTNIIAFDGVSTGVPGGWIDQNWKQLYKQFAYVCAACAYTFVMTALLAKAVDTVPGLKLRGSFDDERVGMDEVEVRFFLRFSIYASILFLFFSRPDTRLTPLRKQIGEFANDYIEVRRDFADGNGFDSGNGFQHPLVAAGDRHAQPDRGSHELPRSYPHGEPGNTHDLQPRPSITEESQGASLDAISEKPEKELVT